MFFYQFILLLCFVMFSAGDQFEDECGLEAIYAVPLVSRGQKVSRNQFPWHVAIFRKNETGQFEQICGGSIVRSQIVISAAHCFSDEITNHMVQLNHYRVVGGVLHRSWNGVRTGRQAKKVLTVRLGETFGGSTRNYQDDIAIVQLKTKFTFSNVVRAVCLDLVDRDLHTMQTSRGSVGKVTGWGLTEAGVLSESLNFLSVPVVAGSQCTELLPFTFVAHITSDKLCAGLRNGTAVCQGDSGGGLVFPLQNSSTTFPRWYLRGVLSNAPLSTNLSSPCLTNTLALYTDLIKIGFWLSTNMDDLQPQGAGCRVRESVGVCRNFSACPSAMEAASRGTLPPKCSLSNADLICCVEMEDSCPPLPPSTVSQRKTGSKANDYCVELAEKLFPCQWNSSGWSRGNLCKSESEPTPGVYLFVHDNSKSEVPRYALLGLEASFYTYGAAAAILVSERWLLVLQSSLDGVLRYSGSDIILDSLATFTIARTVRHPLDLLTNLTAHQCALVEMDTPVTFSKSIQPLCLHFLPPGGPLQRNSTEGLVDLIFSHGMGLRRDVPVDILSPEECRRQTSDLHEPSRLDYLICATPREKQRCSGLLNSTALTVDNSQQVACSRLLVGVLSASQTVGDDCKLTYLRVSLFTPWIESVVWP